MAPTMRGIYDRMIMEMLDVVQRQESVSNDWLWAYGSDRGSVDWRNEKSLVTRLDHLKAHLRLRSRSLCAENGNQIKRHCNMGCIGRSWTWW